jgi:hypothetical protein
LVLNPSVDNWVDTTSTPSPTVVTPIVNKPVIVSPPVTVVTQPPVVVPQPPIEEIVTEITNVRSSWGPDSSGGYHAITFDWRTNLGKTGRVNTDIHLSPALKSPVPTKNANGVPVTSSSSKLKLGSNGYNGEYARSLINKRYNDPGVKEYLNAGTHFDQKPPAKW